jgi:hypothetical protein
VTALAINRGAPVKLTAAVWDPDKPLTAVFFLTDTQVQLSGVPEDGFCPQGGCVPGPLTPLPAVGSATLVVESPPPCAVSGTPAVASPSPAAGQSTSPAAAPTPAAQASPSPGATDRPCLPSSSPSGPSSRSDIPIALVGAVLGILVLILVARLLLARR